MLMSLWWVFVSFFTISSHFFHFIRFVINFSYHIDGNNEKTDITKEWKDQTNNNEFEIQLNAYLLA